MATFLNLDQEKLAEADKHEQRKANTLGADRPVAEEPFGSSEIVLREDIFSETPTADTNFSAPDYGEWPQGNPWSLDYGAVASRRSMFRLHPLINSGLTGPQSIQTFVIVESAPASDDPVDIEAVRIKHLVPPDLSIGRSDAAEPDSTKRGFQLALFPAYDNGGTLDGYVGYGSIPITADPTAADGIGDDARWTVDYANGIVRFSSPPLNGSTGIMNPFGVYGDIDGNTVTGDAGRVTMFATFYQYTGPTLTDPDDVRMVTVGDGTKSFGTFYGPTSTVMQAAVTSLGSTGGVVYLKEGDYTYTTDVEISAGVNILGLSRNAIITRPSTKPAFTLYGSNSSVKGVTIKTVSSGTPTDVRADVEISTTAISQTIENVVVSNNELWATDDAYGVGFAPRHMNAIYKDVVISGNKFDCYGFTNPIFIGEGYDGGSVSLENITIRDNNFVVSGSAVDGYAVYFTGHLVEDIRELHIADNHMDGEVGILINIDTIPENMYIANNSEFGNMHISGMSGSIIKNNIFTNAYLDGYVTDSQFNDNIISELDIANAINDFNLVGNICFGDVTLVGDDPDLDWEIANVVVSNNKFHQNLYVSHDITTDGVHAVKNLAIENNFIGYALEFGYGFSVSSGNLTYVDLRVTNNIIGDIDGSSSTSIKFGESAADAIYINGGVFSGNTLHNDAIFYSRVYTTSSDNGLKFNNNVMPSGKGIYMQSSVLNNVSIADNRLSSIELFSSPVDSADSTTVGGISIKNNTLVETCNITLHDMTATTMFTLNDVAIENNVSESTGSVSILESLAATNKYTINNLTVSSNKIVDGSINLGGALNSSSAFNDFAIRNNQVANGITIEEAGISRAHIGENITDGTSDITIGGDISSSEIYSNRVGNLIIQDGYTVVGSNIVGNFVSTNIEFYSIGDSNNSVIIANNNVAGAISIFGSVFNTKFDGNKVNGQAKITGTTQDSTVSGNNFGSLDAAQVVGSSVTNNIIEGDFTPSVLSSSELSQNIIQGEFAVANLTNASINDNVFGDVGLDTDIVTITLFFRRSSFSNNTILRDINEASIGGLGISASIVEDSVVSGNMIYGDLIIGNDADRMNITNNECRSMSVAGLSGSTVNGNSVNRWTGPAAGALLSIGDITKTSVVGNTFVGDYATQVSIGDCDDVGFSDNILIISSSSDITFGRLSGSNISGCRFKASKVTFDHMSASNFSDAYVEADFEISRAGSLMVNSRISDSHITGSVNLDSTLGVAFIESTITSTRFGGDFSASADEVMFQNSHFDGNIVYGDASWSVTNMAVGTHLLLDGSTTDGNTFMSGLVCWGSSNKITYIKDSSISSNKFGSLVVIGDTMSTSGPVTEHLFVDSTFSSNYVDGYLSIGPSGRSYSEYTHLGSTFSHNNVNGYINAYGSFNACIIDGNYTRSSMYLGQLFGTSFTNNIIGSEGVDEGTFDVVNIIEGSVLSGNIFEEKFTVSSNLADSTLSGNTFLNAVEFSSDIDGSVINSNQIFGSSISGLSVYFDGDVSKTSFSNNRAHRNVEFASGVETSDISNNVIDTDMIFSGNSLETSTISGNRLDTLQVSSSSRPTSIVISDNSAVYIKLYSNLSKQYVTISNNNINTLDIQGGSVTDSQIIGNNIIAFSSSPLITETEFLGNHVQNACTILGMSNGVFGSNEFDDSLTFTAQSVGMIIQGNSIATDMTFNDITNSSVTNNIFNSLSGTTTTGTMGNTVFSNNKINISNINYLSECIIESNIFAGVATFASSINDVVISGNHFDSVSNNGTCNRSAFNNNTFSGTFVVGVLNDCVVSSNVVAYGFSAGTWTNTNCTGNTFNSSVVMTGAITGSSFGNNYVDDAFYSGRWTDVTCNGNTFNSTVTVTESGSNACITRVAFQGNVCKGLVHFAKPTHGTANNFLHGTFSGNVFHVGLVFGSSGYQNEHTRIAVNNNSGAGYVMFYVGIGGSEMDSCMVVGNTMTGAFTVSPTDASTYPVPPTTGTSHVMLALNWFDDYHGINFTDPKISIGWSDSNDGLVYGSNMKSNAS